MRLLPPTTPVIERTTRFRRAFLRRIFDLVVSAFGLVAALAWNETITELVKQYIPEGSAVSARLVYAILVTLLAVMVTMQLGSIAARLNLDEERRDDAQKRR